jgi:hypothetical protein
VLAHHSSVANRSLKLLKRKRAMVAVLVAFIALAGFGVWQWRRVEIQNTAVAARETHLRSLLDQVEAHLDQSSGTPPDTVLSQRSQDVQSVRTAFATDFPAVVAAKPGPSATRDALLDRGVRYVERAHATPVRSANLDSEVAAAYQQFGILQENTADPKAGGRQAAVKTYQKASEVLVTLASENPADTRARERLASINERIVSLGGQAVSAPVESAPVATDVPKPEPEKAPVPVAAPKTPPPAKAAAPVAVTTPPAPAPEPVKPAPAPVAPSATPAPAGLSAAVRAELNDRMINATAKVQGAEQAIEPIKQNLASRGQTLNSDTQNAMVQMRGRLEKAKAEIASGDASAAKDDMAAAEAFATRVLRTAGR